MRSCKTLKSKFGPSLNASDQRNLLHKSTFNSYHFQPDLPKLPIPTVESTLSRYLTSLSAQEQTIGLSAIEKAKSLSKSEKPAIDNLHKMLLDYDSSIKKEECNKRSSRNSSWPQKQNISHPRGTVTLPNSQATSSCSSSI